MEQDNFAVSSGGVIDSGIRWHPAWRRSKGMAEKRVPIKACHGLALLDIIGMVALGSTCQRFHPTVRLVPWRDPIGQIAP